MLIFLVKFFLSVSALIVIILVMLQRGKGGGLAGALGGAGGQSAFGTKAGVLFTKITIIVASFWIVISILTAIFAQSLSSNQISATVVQPGPSASPAEKSTDSGSAKAKSSATVPGVVEKGGKGSETPAKPAEKSPAKAAVTPVVTPATPATTPPAKPLAPTPGGVPATPPTTPSGTIPTPTAGTPSSPPAITPPTTPATPPAKAAAAGSTAPTK